MPDSFQRPKLERKTQTMLSVKKKKKNVFDLTLREMKLENILELL